MFPFFLEMFFYLQMIMCTRDRFPALLSISIYLLSSSQGNNYSMSTPPTHTPFFILACYGHFIEIGKVITGLQLLLFSPRRLCSFSHSVDAVTLHSYSCFCSLLMFFLNILHHSTSLTLSKQYLSTTQSFRTSSCFMAATYFVCIFISG